MSSFNEHSLEMAIMELFEQHGTRGTGPCLTQGILPCDESCKEQILICANCKRKCMIYCSRKKQVTKN